MPKFSKIINDEDLKERTETDSPYYKKRITGFKNKIFPEDFTMSKENEINLLREELKLTHKAYLSKIKTLTDKSDYMECRYNNLFVQFSKYRKTSHDKEEKLLNNILDAEDEVEKYFNDLIDCRIERTGWIGRTLKYQYLFEQMKKIGLQQSEDIFECFEDIEVPEVSIKIKDRFVPTTLTDNIEPAEEDYWSDEDIIGDYSGDEPAEEGIPPEPAEEGIPPEPELEGNIIFSQDDNQRIYSLPPIGWAGNFIRSEPDGCFALLNGEWVKCENISDYHHDSIIKIQKVFRGYISRIKNQE